jgi:hypothetical protein
MNTIDYSKNDIFDVNNRLFRIARNNISALEEPIKDMDDHEQQNAENNLLIYGSELINNLNQINYTFQQLESYIFVPSKITKKNIKAVIEEGTNAKVEDIKAPTPPLPVEEVLEPLPEQPEDENFEENPEDDYRNDLEFEDELLDFIKNNKSFSKEEKLKIVLDALKDYNFTGLENIKTLSDVKKYIKSIKREEPEFIDDEEPEFIGEEESNLERGLKDIDEEIQYYDDAMLKIQNEYDTLHKKDSTDAKLEEYEKQYEKYLIGLEELKSIKKGIQQDLGILDGSGRKKFLGGAKSQKKVSKVAKSIVAKVKTPKKAKNPVVNEDVDEFNYVDDNDVEDQQKSNLDDAQQLNKSLVDVVNTGQKTPVPMYISKIYELMTGLIQFIGRTTVLYITKIKKNLNYLSEEQYKKIYNAIEKFEGNLSILSQYKNKGGALIKDTLYNQLENETLGLYHEIYNSIRNYNKFVEYKGSGIQHNKYDRLVGGYFIQSDNPFIEHSTTKRFL